MQVWLEHLSGLGPLGWLISVLELGLIAYLAIGFYRAIRGTRAMPVAVGVLILIGLNWTSAELGPRLLYSVLNLLGPYIAVILIVIFQPELRRMFHQITLDFIPKSRLRKSGKNNYQNVIDAVDQLSRSKVGGLIIIERETELGTFARNGQPLDAVLSCDLLVSIFNRSSPLHDGAVIIRGSRVVAAACLLPVSVDMQTSPILGTRHLAAINVTSESDCLTIVVSEKDGGVALSVNGQLEPDLSIVQLRSRLIHYLEPDVVFDSAPVEE